jgi:hypothetical protein
MIALALLLVACSQANGKQAAAVVTPTKPVTSSGPSGKGLPSPTPTSTIDLPLAVLPFNCRLPISTPDGQGAFISLTQGNVSFDPKGTGDYYYDRAFSKWVPVPRSAVSPDGAHYASAETGQDEFLVHVVDVASGQDHVFHESAAELNAPPIVIDYSPEGIYLGEAFEHLLGGLWLVNPTTGAMRQISSTVLPIAITPGAVWVEALNPADRNPVVTGSSAGTLPDEIDRVDLTTGEQQAWFYQPGTGVRIVGFDLSGHPLVDTSGWGIDPAAELFIARAPATRKSIYKGVVVQSMGGGIADVHGVWIGSAQGIYFYSDANGLQKVSNQPGYPANGCF